MSGLRRIFSDEEIARLAAVFPNYAREEDSDLDIVEDDEDLEVKDLHKKWKNLRQCYKRERDSQVSKSGFAKKKKLKYVYYDILSFLAPVFAAKPTHSNIGDAEQGDDEEDEEEEEEEGGHVEEATEEVETENTNIPLQSSTAPRKRKRASENPVADICLVLKRSLEAAEQRKVEEKKTMDEDTNFLMSLLNYIRPVQGLNKLAMRSEILQVVTKYYNMTQHPQNLYPSSSQRYPLPRHFSPYPSSSYIPSYPSHVMTAPSPVMNVPSFSAYTSSDSTSPQLSELCSPQRDPCQQTADLDFPHDTV